MKSTDIPMAGKVASKVALNGCKTLAGNNKKDTLEPDESLLHRRFERIAGIYGQKVALEYPQHPVTYNELNQLAENLSRYLASLAVGAHQRVGILLERSVYTYVSILAILKTGAAYVPLDVSFPMERIEFIARDAGLVKIITVGHLLPLLGNAVSLAVVVPGDMENTARKDDEGKDCLRTGLNSCGKNSGDGLCYVIYTSGSTGRPKGVAVEHKSVCNLVSIYKDIYDIQPGDRVYQGLSIAFDFSIDEIWGAWLAGATIVPAPTGINLIGAELGDFLIEKKITVLCSVPTVLSTIDVDIPSLRLLIAGGETFTQELAGRWLRKGRRVLNTYGPTETTVTATWSELLPGHRVTIGRPLPSYQVFIADKGLQPVPDGVPGEIVIGGEGVARGYLNRDNLNREKFVLLPNGKRRNQKDGNQKDRFYRTGDIGRITPSGEIEFLGRLDSQVKIRGYRIEPGEIEALILEDPALLQAAVTTFNHAGYPQELVCFIVVQDNKGDNENTVTALYEKLRIRLPAYMVPDSIEIIPSMPLLASGKVDRANLPLPSGRRNRTNKGYIVPRTGDELLVASVWSEIFRLERVSADDDFFLDLGGHSMFAALAVSSLRKDPRFTHLSMSDIYGNPTIRSLAKCARYTGGSPRGQAGVKESVCTSETTGPPTTGSVCSKVSRNFILCGFIQAFAIYSLVTAVASPLLLFLAHIDNHYSLNFLQRGILAVSFWFAAMLAMSFALPIIGKWLLLGRVKPGTYPLWGGFYIRWWIVRKLQDLSVARLLAGSPLINVFARLMGASIGKGCFIGSPHIGVYDMLVIGEGSSVGYDTHMPGYTIEDGAIFIAPIKIGKDCMVGNKSVLQPGCTIEDGGRLGNQSLLPSGATIAACQSWSGSPARKDSTLGKSKDSLENLPPNPCETYGITGYAGFVAGVLALALVPAIAFLPGIALMFWIYRIYGGLWYLLACLPGGIAFVSCICIFTVLGKAVLLPRVKPGTYRLDSWFYYRKWLTDKLIESSLLYTQSLYATLYVLPFLRLLGARVGKRVEVSTASHITPELLTIDDESFIADFAHVGTPQIHRGHIEIAPVRIGKRSFAGNSSMLPSGYNLPDKSLLGVMSIPPAGELAVGSGWLGSPAMYLPRREINNKFSINETFLPPVKLYVKRLFYELLRVILPAGMIFLASGLMLKSGELATRLLSARWLIFIAAFLYFGSNSATTAVVVLTKKLLIGTYKPLERPLWSNFVWRSELVTALYENVTVPGLLFFLTGTPFAAMILRLFGAGIGKRVFMDTTFVTEFDLVHIDDDSALCHASSLQTHLFEDRVMKMSHLWVGKNCSMGVSSVALYDSRMNDASKLEALSLLMKGETLPAGTSWIGCPAIKND